MNKQTIRSFDVEKDLESLLTLWQRSFGDKWQVSAAHLRLFFARPSKHYICQYQDQLIGFLGLSDCETMVRTLVVAPSFRRQGIATKLMQAASWPDQFGGALFPFNGVPEEAIEMRCALARWGYRAHPQANLDQLVFLNDWPSDWQSAPSSLTFSQGKVSDILAIEQFVDQEFPEWLCYYHGLLQQDQQQVSLISLMYVDGSLAGIGMLGDDLRITSPGTHWKKLVDMSFSSLALFGVAKKHRGLGFAPYFFHYILSELRGFDRSIVFINSSGAPELYRKFGAIDYARFEIFSKN